MTDPDFPPPPQAAPTDEPENLTHEDVSSTLTEENPLDHVSDEDPTHDPFKDYPEGTVVDDDDTEDDGAVDLDDTEAGA